MRGKGLFSILLFIVLTPEVAAEEVATYRTARNWVTDYVDAGGDVMNVTGLKRPANWKLGAKFLNLKAASDLPASFNWNNQVAWGLQPIRDQGACGSCWAFSITAVVESLMRIKAENEPYPNLSEQTLVDCSPYDCSGGYFDAFDYVENKGLANRTDYPYSAVNRRCRVKDSMVKQKVVSWAYVGSEDRSPTTDEIKTAIMKYGPVSVDVAATGRFMAYHEGVFNGCSFAGINHMVTLEGWSDSDGGYWILRNSWGTDWGEKGYMRIRFTDSRGRKCNQVGDSAVVAVLE